MDAPKMKHADKLLFSMLLAAANRLIITLAPFITEGRPIFPDILSWEVFREAVYSGLNRYDAGWYEKIAALGYTDAKSSAFFPLYPLLMRVSSLITGFSYKVCGQGISLVCFVIALWLVQELADDGEIMLFTQTRRGRGRWIACIIAFSPVSFYYSISYTESLFFMLTLLFMMAVARKKWFLAGAAGFFAGLTRNSGALLAVIFLLEYLRWAFPGREKGRDSPPDRAVPAHQNDGGHGISLFRPYASFFSILLIPAGSILYFSYLYIRFGSFYSALNAVDRFGRSGMAPWRTLYLGILLNIEKISATDNPYIFNYFLLELLAVLAFLFAAFYLIGRVPLSYNLFMTLSLLLPLCKPAYAGLTDYFVSFPRYTSTLLPYFIAIYGIFRRSRKAFIFYLASSIHMLVKCVSFWSNGKFIS